MSTQAPHTPDSTPRKAALTRSFTLPSKIAATHNTRSTNSSTEIGATKDVETLCFHPNSKIVKFTSAATTRPSNSARTASPGGQHGQGTLPWANSSEHTLAAGPLEIYRVPGSVSFLHSGSLLHAILPRSNCWCVDGVSKFAMRVLPETYYRIELPGDTPEDLQKVEEFKETLKKVLFYERTACPFARTFSVDLPDEPQVRKKKRRYHGPAKKWKLDKAYSWRPEDGGEPPSRDDEASSGSVSMSDDEASSSAEEQSDSSEVADQVSELKISTPSRPSVRERARGFNLRSVTAPPQLALQATPPSRLRTSLALDHATQDGARSGEPASSSALDPSVLRPFQAIPTDMPPSPPDSSAGLDFAETPHRVEDRTNYQQMSADSNTLSLNEHAGEVIPPAAGDQHPREPPAASDLGHASPGQWEQDVQMKEEAEAATLLASNNVNASLESHEAQDVREFVRKEDNQELLRETVHDSRLESGQGSINVTPSQIDPEVDNEQPPAQYAHDTEADETASPGEALDIHDPFAQIQARIQARRSIGGTTSFHLNVKSPTRQSSLSTASSSSLASSKSSASRRPHPTQQQQQAFASALVRKACATFLGPPAHLVMIMLRIAARFAKGAFPSALIFESPAGTPKRVPGSFDLDGSDIEDFGLDDVDDLDWEEDDFGVPLRSPVRLASIADGGAVSTAVREHMKGRGGWSTSPEP